MKNLLERIIRKSKKIYSSTESSFRKKTLRGEFVDLVDWANRAPDEYISSYNNILCDEKFKRVSQIVHVENRILMSVREMWNLFNWVQRTSHLSGDMAEVGVYRGGSSKLICEANGNKTLHIFDTFEGIPEVEPSIDKVKKGQFKGDSLEEIKNYLNQYNNVSYYKGWFPKSAERESLSNAIKFSFVNLDVDVYLSTLESLKFFYPRMSTGGVIIAHDYRCIHAPGVKKAFDEFIKGKPETIVELWDTQALIIKL